ncbi:hypothetical protein MKW98_016737 [Papaver atlanticum]|uniref:Helicase ATP-binding domain-containing protein n=1 Tax=Papaver atlanticum TaxID=357466 RepID=A0AAD4TGN0_9MAGN|nr:hypothetical protein MKW98_016737 [Papaver atlanticum]
MLADNDMDEAIKILQYRQGGSVTPLATVKKTVTSTGSRVSAVVKQEISNTPEEENDLNNDFKKPKIEESVKEEPEMSSMDIDKESVKEEKTDLGFNQYDNKNPSSTSTSDRPPVTKQAKKPVSKMVEKKEDIDDGEFPEEEDWLLVGRSTVAGLSTCKRKKLAFNEIIGRLPLEWTKSVVPLVNSTRVKLCGRSVVAAPQTELRLMQEIHLYVSFYIHRSVFVEGDKTSWNLTPPSHVESVFHPLPTLFQLLRIKAFKKAEFTPEELDNRNRSLNLHTMPVAKKTRGGQSQPVLEQANDEQTFSESTLNNLVGAADVYNFEEMEPPSTLKCVLHSYQKEALYWMLRKLQKSLHPCWEVYRITDKRASEVYVNVFSGEATTQFPSATQATRGGILADAMGLGKTVMTITLIHARRGRGTPYSQEIVKHDPDQVSRRSRSSQATSSAPNVKGVTLIVCPMALLGQWKDELETHSQPGTLGLYVQYGVDRTTHPNALAQHDVVLTTYGGYSIFHQVDRFRVVLDEAHTIKSSRTQVAQAAFSLSSYCQWCLTGTPIQNNLENLYSLLCFLHVEPWCNWAWWYKLIQRPYENGDERGIRIQETKKGRRILVLPPADIQVIECEQSDAECDFYSALFKRSKIQFDQFVAKAKFFTIMHLFLSFYYDYDSVATHPYLVIRFTKICRLEQTCNEISWNELKCYQ